LIVRKKKADDDEAYFIGGKSKKGKKGGAKANGSSEAPSSPSSSTSLNVPLPTLSALLSLSIPPPTATADVPRVIEDLKTKKAWFEANQSRVTAENITKAEADIKRLTSGAKSSAKGDEHSSATALPPSNGEVTEPTLALKGDVLSETGEPDCKTPATLEGVQEQEVVANE